MKKLVLALSLSLFIAPTVIAAGWTPISQEQAEYEMIMRDIAQIQNYFANMGGLNGSAYPRTLFEYLRSVGTETSLKVLKKLVDSRQIPKYYLDKI
jgi:hypothetical protein